MVSTIGGGSSRLPETDRHACVVRNTFIEVESPSRADMKMRPAKSVPLSCLIGDKEERLAMIFADDDQSSGPEDSDPVAPLPKRGPSDARVVADSAEKMLLPSSNGTGHKVRAVTFMLPSPTPPSATTSTTLSSLKVKNTFLSIEESAGDGDTPVMRPFKSVPVTFATDLEDDSSPSGVPRDASARSVTSVVTPQNMCQLKTLSLNPNPEGPHLGLLYAPEGQLWDDETKAVLTAGNNRFHVKMGDAEAIAERTTAAAVAAVPRPALSPEVAASQATRSIIGRVWELSEDAQGCRQVQQALDEGTAQERRMIAAELVGHIAEGCRGCHSNFVLQRCVATMPATDLQFIVDELQGDVAVQASKHKFGCRIVQRIMEKVTIAQKLSLAEAIIGDMAAVARHPYGNYVIQNLLEHAGLEQRERIVRKVQQDVRGLASDSFGCTVVTAAMSKGPQEVQGLVAEALLHEPGLLVFTACTRHGHAAVVRALQVLEGENLASARALLHAEVDSLRASRFGKNVADCL